MVGSLVSLMCAHLGVVACGTCHVLAIKFIIQQIKHRDIAHCEMEFTRKFTPHHIIMV